MIVVEEAKIHRETRFLEYFVVRPNIEQTWGWSSIVIITVILTVYILLINLHHSHRDLLTWTK